MRVLQCREGANAAIPEAQQTSCEYRYVIIMTFAEPMTSHGTGTPRDAKTENNGRLAMSMLSLHRRAALRLIGGLAAACAGVFPSLPARAADSTVTLWSWRTEDEAAMRRIFDAFEVKKPGIKVAIQFTPDADYQNRLSTALRGGRGPDIAQLKAYGELQPFVEAGYLDALDDSVPELKNMEDAALGARAAALTEKSTVCPTRCR